MAVLLEGPCNFTPEERKFTDFCCGEQFPWYYGKATNNFYCMTHFLLQAAIDQKPGILRSIYSEPAEALFRRICADNNITLRTIYRLSLNRTFADPSKHGDPHKDHPNFPHTIMLIYLNEFDDGLTFLFDQECKTIVDTIVPKLDHFVVFDGDWHAQGFCRPQQSRVALVATFDGDVA